MTTNNNTSSTALPLILREAMVCPWFANGYVPAFIDQRETYVGGYMTWGGAWFRREFALIMIEASALEFGGENALFIGEVDHIEVKLTGGEIVTLYRLDFGFVERGTVWAHPVEEGDRPSEKLAALKDELEAEALNRSEGITHTHEVSGPEWEGEEEDTPPTKMFRTVEREDGWVITSIDVIDDNKSLQDETWFERSDMVAMVEYVVELVNKGFVLVE